jgi:hypothetical protein
LRRPRSVTSREEREQQQILYSGSQNGFSSKGDSFYVDVKGSYHERKGAEALFELLTYELSPPVLSKAGKVAKRQPKLPK